MWFPIVLVCFAFPVVLLALVKRRRSRLRDRRMILGEMRDFVRTLEDPLRAGEVAFTGPRRDDEDRSYDTMFGVRHGHRLLSFILDTSGMRIRWWTLYELFAPDSGERTLRVETTFVSGAIPVAPIQALLKAAYASAARPAALERPEGRVDPFDPVEPPAAPTEAAVPPLPAPPPDPPAPNPLPD